MWCANITGVLSQLPTRNHNPLRWIGFHPHVVFTSHLSSVWSRWPRSRRTRSCPNSRPSGTWWRREEWTVRRSTSTVGPSTLSNLILGITTPTVARQWSGRTQSAQASQFCSNPVGVWQQMFPMKIQNGDIKFGTDHSAISQFSITDYKCWWLESGSRAVPCHVMVMLLYTTVWNIWHISRKGFYIWFARRNVVEPTLGFSCM